MHKIVERLLRILLNFLVVYLILDGVIHLLNIRLQSVANIWPASAISYATLLDFIYASFVFLAAMLLLVAQKSLTKYKSLIFISSIWAVFHGLLLVRLSFTQDFMNKFAGLPSLYVWMPFYDQYLIIEAFLAFVYAALVFIWLKNE